MPYVEVWVDDLPECTGSCDKAREVKHRRDRGVELLLGGNINAAIDILTLAPLPEKHLIPKETQEKFAAWRAGELDGFDGPAQKEGQADG